MNDKAKRPLLCPKLTIASGGCKGHLGKKIWDDRKFENLIHHFWVTGGRGDNFFCVKNCLNFYLLDVNCASCGVKRTLFTWILELSCCFFNGVKMSPKWTIPPISRSTSPQVTCVAFLATSDLISRRQRIGLRISCGDSPWYRQGEPLRDPQRTCLGSQLRATAQVARW